MVQGGGYMLGAAHCLQDDVSPENIITMFSAAKKYGKYPLSEEIIKLRDMIPRDYIPGG